MTSVGHVACMTPMLNAHISVGEYERKKHLLEIGVDGKKVLKQ